MHTPYVILHTRCQTLVLRRWLPYVFYQRPAVSEPRLDTKYDARHTTYTLSWSARPTPYTKGPTLDTIHPMIYTIDDLPDTWHQRPYTSGQFVHTRHALLRTLCTVLSCLCHIPSTTVHAPPERHLRYQKLKHYYIIEFTQTSGQLKEFINNILGPNDDIVRFEYIKKTNKDMGNVLIGIQLINREDISSIENKLKENNFKFIQINENNLLYSYLI